jgi:glycosyltransferase involved in cell wall biosynthesis
MPPQNCKKHYTKPLVTVVTIVLNADRRIEKTIQSVINQTYGNIEHIIIDGGSLDKTVEIIKQYEKQIDYWGSEPDKGISDAFNKGISLSTGNWICFLNAGDVFLTENVVEEVSNYFKHNHIITGFAQFGKKLIPKRILKNNDKIHVKSMISHQATWINKEVFESVGWFDEDFQIRMDYEFWLRALKEYNFLFIDTTFVIYDVDGISGKDLKLFYDEERKANRKNVARPYFINMMAQMKYIVKSTMALF